ncbi:hypothetical protein [Pseudalkalibacillus salsuginis]|uniref:hypothetical protein n=1 Tax=Pseudalkalibacillus salsuginis TaxID=2910972 RepID=UPI001F44183B|nr:hypothetical protein [Pseudalkalibacillus salsuginis]MCF6409360.1 hypothetical protein [Pseudalkalibacillus salsuginis]
MSKTLNIWSFLIMFLSVGLFFTQSFVVQIIQPSIGHQLTLALSLLAFLLGVIGMFSIDNWKAAFRSILTVFFSASLSVVLTFIMFIGLLFD